MDINNRTCHVDVSQLCRLCAVQDEHVVPIFEGHGLDLEFEVKLEKYLSLKVSKDDILPLHLCLKCSNTLMSWHELVIGCKEAEQRLVSLLCENDNRSDFDGDVVFLDDNSQDSVKIIESDTSEIQLVSQPNNDSGKFDLVVSDVRAKNATIQEHQSNSPDTRGTGTLLPSIDKRQDSDSDRFPGQLLFGQSQPISTRGTVQSLQSQKNENAVTTQPSSGHLSSGQSPPQSARDSVQLLNSQESKSAGNVNKAQPILQPNAAQTIQTQFVPTPAVKNPAQDKGVILSGKKFKTIVKPFLLSRPENSTAVARPSTSAPAPSTSIPAPRIIAPAPSASAPAPGIITPALSTSAPAPSISALAPSTSAPAPSTSAPAPSRENIITLLIPGLIPPNSNAVLSTDSVSNTPVITLPIILPEQPTNQLDDSNIGENAIVFVQNSNSEVRLQGTSNFVLNNDTTNLMNNGVDNNSTGLSFSSTSKSLLKSVLTASGESRNEIIQNDGRPETNKNASGEPEPIYVESLDDHRYSKSAKAFEDSSAKQKNKDRASSRKSILKALKRRIKSKGCFVCGKIIHNRTLRYSHERSHFKTLEFLSYNCTLCGDSFKTFDEMVLHRKKHRKDEAAKKRREREAAARSQSADNPGTETSGEDKNSSGGPKVNFTKQVPKEVRPNLKCVICGVFFYNKIQLNDHKESSHTEEERKNPYSCPTCGKRFATNNSIRSHLKIHDDGPGELCPHCGKVFKLKSTLNQHVRKMHDVPNPWPKLLCEYCPREFDSRAKLLTHLNCHTGERPYACKKCDKAFHSQSNLKQHSACHEEARPCMCHICGKTFKWPKNLKQHTVTHVSKQLRPKTSKQDPVECNLCGKKLNGVGSLKTHKYRFHRDVFFTENPNIQRLPCHLCSRVFSSNVNLDLHLRRFHADGQQRFSCDVCGKRFTTKVGRNDHLRLHTGERPYACNLCDKTFTCASNLSAHKDAHSETRPHQCQYCDKQFKRKAHLDCHVRSHTGEKPYVCDVCNRGFAQSNDMRKHRSIHFDERPFQCSFCESTFKKKNELLRHLAKHCVSERQGDESEDIDYTAILPPDNDAIVAYEVC